MSQTSIFERSWLDLVFEGKNKTYGAYQLRLENPRTTMLAMLYALLFIGGIAGGGLLLSSFGNKPNRNFLPPVEKDSIIVTHVEFEEEIKPEIEKPKTQPQPQQPIVQPDWSNPIIVRSDQTPDVVTVDTQVSAPATNGTEGTPTTDPGTNAGTGDTEPKGNGDEIGTTVMLDRQPMFPGGMQAFYTYVGNNFDKPELDDPKAIRIFVEFVIEKDGSMTNIQVKNKPGYELEKEAVRVLKSLKKKWEPGMRKGQPMRVLYTLPITIKPE